MGMEILEIDHGLSTCALPMQTQACAVDFSNDFLTLLFSKFDFREAKKDKIAIQ